MCGHLDGDRHDVDPFIADHRQGIGKPALGTEGRGRFPCTVFVACRHSREFHAGESVDRRNVRQRRPAYLGVRTDDSDTKFFGHGRASRYLVIMTLLLCSSHRGVLRALLRNEHATRPKRSRTAVATRTEVPMFDRSPTNVDFALSAGGERGCQRFCAART